MHGPTNFKVPSDQARKSALGSLAGANYILKKQLPLLLPLFKPVPKPGPDDWLYSHDQDGQTYDTYLSQQKNKVSKDCNTIVILPLTTKLPKDLIATLLSYCQFFYLGMKVEVEQPRALNSLGVDSRVNQYTAKQQFNASQILRKLENRVKKHMYCLLAITDQDLYPKDEWNFVFGLGSLRNRTGVFSTARYDERFFTLKQFQPDSIQVLRSSIKVMMHEIGHMFGIKHCVYFNCLMNGSNHAQESQKKPIEFCPICLRKLHHQLNFPLKERYEGLSQVAKEAGLEDWHQYLTSLAESIQAIKSK